MYNLDSMSITRTKNGVMIIAEVGVNHNGSVEMAKSIADVAIDSGVDAVKFQVFTPEALVTRSAVKATYQIENTGTNESQLEMLRKLVLPLVAQQELKIYCESKGAMFLSSPFDMPSIDLLGSIGVTIFKIPSGEITNLPYLRKMGRYGRNIIMSTGMADMEEVTTALKVLIEAGTPKNQITVLHCHTDYPTAMEDVNLRAMCTIRDALGVEVGYSDHTPGIEIPIAAVALGARVIEKHFTLSKLMPGPDHRASLEPDELKAMVQAIRNIEKALGNGVKKPTPRELTIAEVARKSVVTLRPISKGELFTEENLTTKRPGTGISPMKWDEIIGTPAPRDFLEDELVEL